MSNKTDWDIASQPAVHNYVEQNLVIPYLETLYGNLEFAANQYKHNQKNGDRLFENEKTRITLERKHDRSDRSTDFAFELLGNQPMNSWTSLPPRLRKSRDATEHRKMVERIAKYRFSEYFDNSKAGLIFADVKNMGHHYTVAVRHYPLLKKTECWLLATRLLQSEVKQNLINIDIGRTMPEKYGDNWKVVLAFVALPSLVLTTKPNINGDCIAAQWDISDVYPMLVDKKEIPTELSNTK